MQDFFFGIIISIVSLIYNIISNILNIIPIGFFLNILKWFHFDIWINGVFETLLQQGNIDGKIALYLVLLSIITMLIIVLYISFKGIYKIFSGMRYLYFEDQKQKNNEDIISNLGLKQFEEIVEGDMNRYKKEKIKKSGSASIINRPLYSLMALGRVLNENAFRLYKKLFYKTGKDPEEIYKNIGYINALFVYLYGLIPSNKMLKSSKTTRYIKGTFIGMLILLFIYGGLNAYYIYIKSDNSKSDVIDYTDKEIIKLEQLVGTYTEHKSCNSVENTKQYIGCISVQKKEKSKKNKVFIQKFEDFINLTLKGIVYKNPGGEFDTLYKYYVLSTNKGNYTESELYEKINKLNNYLTEKIVSILLKGNVGSTKYTYVFENTNLFVQRLVTDAELKNKIKNSGIDYERVLRVAVKNSVLSKGIPERLTMVYNIDKYEIKDGLEYKIQNVIWKLLYNIKYKRSEKYVGSILSNNTTLLKLQRYVYNIITFDNKLPLYFGSNHVLIKGEYLKKKLGIIESAKLVKNDEVEESYKDNLEFQKLSKNLKLTNYNSSNIKDDMLYVNPSYSIKVFGLFPTMGPFSFSNRYIANIYYIFLILLAVLQLMVFLFIFFGRFIYLGINYYLFHAETGGILKEFISKEEISLKNELTDFFVRIIIGYLLYLFFMKIFVIQNNYIL